MSKWNRTIQEIFTELQIARENYVEEVKKDGLHERFTNKTGKPFYKVDSPTRPLYDRLVREYVKVHGSHSATSVWKYDKDGFLADIVLELK